MIFNCTPPKTHSAFVSELQDIPTGADSCVTSLSCDPQRSLVAAGLGDGSVRVYDRRMGPSEWCVSIHRSLSTITNLSNARTSPELYY